MQLKKIHPLNKKGRPDEGTRWTGLDFLNFTQGMEKETPGSQSGMGALIHNEGGGPDGGFVPKADPMAALLDVNKDGIDAVMSVAKTMPRGGEFGGNVKNVAEGAATLQQMDESGQKVSQKAVNNMRNAMKETSTDSFYRVEFGVLSEGVKNVGYTHTNENGEKVFQYRTINVPTKDTSELKSKVIKGNN